MKLILDDSGIVHDVLKSYLGPQNTLESSIPDLDSDSHTFSSPIKMFSSPSKLMLGITKFEMHPVEYVPIDVWYIFFCNVLLHGNSHVLTLS